MQHRGSRTHRILVVAALVAALLAVPAVAQKGKPQEEGETSVHFLLKSLAERPSEEIPAILREDIGGRQGTQTIDRRPALSLIVTTDASRETLRELGAEVRAQGDGWATINLLPERLPELVQSGVTQMITLPRKFEPNLEVSVAGTGADHLRTETAGVFSGDTGAGVIIGVVDSGLDLTHPNFQDPSGNTRVLFALDQNTAIECDSSDIDAGLCTGFVDGPSGHGTHVTGIAAGNGAAVNQNGNTYESVGVAPEADIIAVKTTFMDIDIIDAITYIFDKATLLGQPAVVNLSLGGHVGAHDGTDVIEQHIDAQVLASNGRAVVIAAGNERIDNIHAEVDTIHMLSVVGPEFEVPAYTPNGGTANDLVLIGGYYPGGDDLIVHLWTPSGDYLTRDLTTFGPADCITMSSVDGFIWLCNNVNPNYAPASTANEILVLIIDDGGPPPASGSWGMALSGMSVAFGTGEADFWAFSTMGAEFTTHIDQEETLGMPGTAEHGITVGAYNTKVCWEDSGGNPWSYWTDFGLSAVLTDMSWFSSWGPTRDGRLKPDISAPGAAIVSARAATATPNPIFAINNDYLLMQGTSQAAPHVAGAAALLLEDTPTMSAAAIKSALTDNTSQSYFSLYTGAPGAVWDPVFGNGILDLAFLGSDPWETNDHIGHSQQVLSGEVIDGKIIDLADEDHFQVTGMAPGDTLRAELSGLPANYDLQLQQVSAIGIACNNSGPMVTVEATSANGGTTTEVANTTSGWWYADFMRVYSGGGFDATNTYTLKGVVTRQETTSVHNTTGTAQVLPEFIEFKVSGHTTSLGENDYYRVQADAGETITAGLLTMPGNDVRVVGQTGFGAVVTTPPLAGGTYYVQVRRQSGSGTANYSLTMIAN